MLLPPKQSSDISKELTDHLQLHSMLRGYSRASCVLAKTATAAPVYGLFWVPQDALDIPLTVYMKVTLSEYSGKVIHLLRC
jgi:hypothetical protein